MKKLLLLMMCLVLALGLCGCGKGGSVAADPVLEPCREAKLPRGTYTCLGNNLVFCREGRGTSAEEYAIVNLKTGKRTPLSLKDEAAWRTACEEFMLSRSGKDRDFIGMMMEKNPLIDTVLFYGLYPYLVGNGYTICRAGSMYCLLNHRSGELIYLDCLQGNEIDITAWDELVAWERKNDTVSITLYDLKGEALRTAEINVEGYAFCSLRTMEDGFLLLCSNLDRSGKGDSCQAIPLDRTLNASPAISLPLIDALTASRLCFARQNTRTNRVLMQTNDQGLLLLDLPNGQYALLTGRDDQLAVGEMKAYDGAKPETESEKSLPLRVLGFSADGRYALIASMTPGLFKLDMETLEATTQMTSRELLDVMATLDSWYPGENSATPIDFMELVWDGGEYAVGSRYVFRVRER